jgi:HK97 gp10 family phage protein
MPKVVTFKMHGTAELYEALEKQPPLVAKAIIRKALRAAARIWWAEMKIRVRRGWHVFKTTEVKGKRYQGREREYGYLQQHMAIKISTRGDELGGVAQVGPVRGCFWSAFLEFGTSKMRAFPFIRVSFESRKQDVADAYAETARQELRNSMGMR